jgi:hypothetical protein
MPKKSLKGNNFQVVTARSADDPSARDIVEIRSLRPLIGLVSPGTERHGAVH